MSYVLQRSEIIKRCRKKISSSTAALLIFAGSLFIYISPAAAQSRKYEDLRISDVSVTFEGRDTDVAAAEQLRLIAVSVLGEKYSAVRVREAINALYFPSPTSSRSQKTASKIVSAQVEATPVGNDAVSLRFIIKRKTEAGKVDFKIGNVSGDPVTEEELLLKLNILNPGMTLTEQTLRNNADAIQTYLRDRGFYSAEVSYTQRPLESETRVAVTFVVNPNAQSRVENFDINIKGVDAAKFRPTLKLQKDSVFSRAALDADIDRIRKSLIKEGYLAPRLDDTKVTFDSDNNKISIALNGDVGAKIKVSVDAEKEKVGQKTQTRLLPIKRDGSIDFSAIREGGRRLRNYFQENGYFFVEVEEKCSVNPPFPKDEANPLDNDTETLCTALSGLDLTNKEAEVKYYAYLNRRLKLVDIRIEGTKRITIEDVISVLDTQRASFLGKIPRLGYGRGYTSTEILEEDRLKLKSFMRELGYRNADVKAKQGVSPDGENLIITFAVTEGAPTKIDDVEIVGNKVFATDALLTELPNLIEKNYSRARARNGQQKLFEFYAREGYYDADIDFSIVELPKQEDDTEEKVKIVYNVRNEGKKVLINRILINGLALTKRESVVKALNLKEGQILRQTDIFSSEQNLYSTDAFRGLEIRPEAAGETKTGEKLTDVVVNLEEQKPRIITYGGGYSTDLGWSGFFGIRHVNLFGRLQQGGAQIRWSRRQQLLQVDFLDPRFIPDGKNKFAPLSITAQYQRDSTITRFFRSAFDSGTFGIVQRVDANGKPIDTFGAETGDPTINRFSLTAETNRTINKKTRSLLYLRYRFEDVRLFNIDSLLIADLLRPDERVRISGFGATFVRDTRENCSRKFTLIEIITRGEPGSPCRYNPADATRGDYLSVEYNSSIPFMGANVGFNKLQATYQTYYQIPALNNTVLAARAVLGVANVFYKKRKVTSGPFQEFNDVLPISERFFAGGSTTLRGFDFESAGPRVVVNPQGTFRDSKGNIVNLNPFTIPFGGNALAITNLEARFPLTQSLQGVGFYDGGNVFLRAKDIFSRSSALPGDAFKQNLNAGWTNTVGVGVRIKTPFGGSIAIDWGYLLNPPKFIIPQPVPPDGIFIPKRGQLHFRFTQSF